MHGTPPEQNIIQAKMFLELPLRIPDLQDVKSPGNTAGQSQGRQGPKMSPRAPSAQAGNPQVLHPDEVRIQQGGWNQGRIRDSNLTAGFSE